MLHFEGDQQSKQQPAAVHAKLCDTQFLADCLSSGQTITKQEKDTLVFQVRPGFSFARGTLEVTLRIVEATTPTLLRYHVRGKGIGSSNDVEAALTLSAHDDGTRIHWIVDITALGGLLKAVPKGLIHAAAEKVINDLWGTVMAKLNP